MSIEDFIKQKTQQKNQTEAVTVRLASNVVADIDELASTLDSTRQEVINQFVQDGLATALDVYKKQNTPDRFDQVIEGENGATQRYFVLNTNKNNDSDDHQDMVSNGIAAAFEDGWKQKIDILQKGDVVFLYESGVGIVGIGKANGTTEKLDRNGKSEAMYQQKLNDYRKVNSLSAKEIKKTTGTNMRFLQTMFQIKAAQGEQIEHRLS